jgi:hypothetical protein
MRRTPIKAKKKPGAAAPVSPRKKTSERLAEMRAGKKYRSADTDQNKEEKDGKSSNGN